MATNKRTFTLTLTADQIKSLMFSLRIIHGEKLYGGCLSPEDLELVPSDPEELDELIRVFRRILHYDNPQ